MPTLVCRRSALPSTPPITGDLPKGEAVYCIPCLTTLVGYDSTKPDPDAGGAEDRIAVLAGLACGFCYEGLPATATVGLNPTDFTGTGLVRVCGECVDGFREADEISANSQ